MVAMADVGGDTLSGHGVGRQLAMQPGAGDLHMDVEQPLCTAPPDPLPVLMGQDLAAGDAGDRKRGGRCTQPAELGNRAQQCGGDLRDVNTDYHMESTPTPSQGTQPVATQFTSVRNSDFTDIRLFEKKSWQSKPSLAPFYCRLCRRSRPKGTMFVGIFPVGGACIRDWQQICSEPGVETGVAGKLTTSCIAKYTETISASGALHRQERREERQELEEIAAGACPCLPLSPPFPAFLSLPLQPPTSSLLILIP